MVDWIALPYQQKILAGVLETTKNAGWNLLCFVGGQLSPGLPRDPHNRVFDLIARPQVDGLVVFASTLMYRTGQRGIESYCQEHFQNLPLCSIGVTLKGYPSIVVNNEAGIKDLVSHLVRVHGYKRIAFVRGPLNNNDAELRFLAYVETLKELSIPFDPRLVAVGDFMIPSGAEAVRSLTQQPGIRLEELDAVVAANDAMAVGVMEAVTMRGIAVPNTVAVVGFDDVEDAPVTDAPLTTVRQPFEKIGRQAARDLLGWIQHGTVPSSVTIDTEVVLRRSCGCGRRTNQSSLSLAPPPSHQSFETTILMRRDYILGTLTRAARGELGSAGKGWETKVLMALVSELRGESPDAFLRVMEDLGEKLLRQGGNIQACHNVLSTLRSHVLPSLASDIERLGRAEAVFYETHLALGAVAQLGVERDRLRFSRWARELSVACNELGGTLNRAELKATIRRKFASLGLRSYYVVLASDSGIDDSLELFAAGADGCEVSLPDGHRFGSATLLPEEEMRVISSGRAFAVIPLAWMTTYFGYCLFELQVDDTFSYSAVAEAIAVGLHALELGKG